MHYESLAIVAILVIVFSLVSRSLGESWLTPPLFFTAGGLLLGSVGLMGFEVEHETLELLAELTLVAILFTDAARIDLRRLRKETSLPARLLGIGLPLTIALGGLLALVLLPGLGVWQGFLLAAVLAPTDAALGQAVVTSERVPPRLRQTLSVESGLNDGIALPVVTLLVATCLTMEARAQGASGLGQWLAVAGSQIALGVAAGGITGAVSGGLVGAASRRGLMASSFRRIGVLATALLSFLLAHLVDGNGFVAAFVAGLAFGGVTREACHDVYEFAEEEGQLMTLLTFLLFGALLLPEALRQVDLGAVVYVLASLTVVRMIPVALSLFGSGLQTSTVLFLGWFGPRGLASIIFTLLVVGNSGLENADRISTVAFLTVFGSTVLHGITAGPGARWIASRLSDAAPGSAEMLPMAEAAVLRLPGGPDSTPTRGTP